MTAKIHKVDEILTSVLAIDEVYVDHDVDQLNAAGENMASSILSVQIKLKSRKTKAERVLYAVAKQPPPTEYLQGIFNTPVTFKKEIDFYLKVMPFLKEFQVRQGMTNVFDSVAKYLGSRMTINTNTKRVDETSILLLENLKSAEFQMANRLANLDLSTTEIILKNLAQFHAIPIALKLLEPHVFQRDILPYLRDSRVFEDVDRDQFYGDTIKYIQENTECIPLLPRIKASNDRFPNQFYVENCTNNVFATISHNDLWMNNVMIKYVDNQPVAVKFVDFQLFNYGPVSRDIITLLFTSVQLAVLKDHLDDLFDVYYKSFINCLDSFKCDTRLFSFDAFINDIDNTAKKGEIIHVLHLLKAVFRGKDDAQELDKISQDNAYDFTSCFSVDYCNKVEYVVKEFAKRNWI